MEIWIGAYNAALTGLVAARGSTSQFTPNTVGTITEQCRWFADQAVKDAEQHYGERGKRQSRQQMLGEAEEAGELMG